MQLCLGAVPEAGSTEQLETHTDTTTQHKPERERFPAAVSAGKKIRHSTGTQWWREDDIQTVGSGGVSLTR